ncbi:hypothetical protein [Bacteroides acidifaciens]|uniref:YobI family P-loop NTPase n=1 Tax=Bacteroides acidifaciens TaxID=85831 RepID=UPI0025ADF437|nr:hypothetical protein [Bacteroides acidifaciens]
MSEKKLNNLLPALIEKTDKSYVAVEELGQVLQETLSPTAKNIPAGRRIKNIAITGPYGAGKSSIIQTLEKDYPAFKYLNLSLATLRTDEETSKSDEFETDLTDNNKGITYSCTQIESLNRRIEYSILQQIIYKEESGKVPNSRLRRIRHFKTAELVKYGILITAFVLCTFIVFEPTWLKVETFYSMFNFGRVNFWIDLICAFIMIGESFLFIQKLIQAYSNSKLNKLNLKDGEIELAETSIFNKHLDEILYFFQVTKYNVVVIEDVDRFGTTDIFLKLRELNQLINESNVIGRSVVFLYAVKDDLFKNEDRVKFFDYIVTVVPTINPSNSKDRLKNLLSEKGHTNFNDDDLSEMGFFIQDMRMLINIVNEYDQYHQRLIKENANLDCTKLLGMIVYKNFFPSDFAKLHRREGIVFQVMQLKDTFVSFAQTDIIKREKNIDDFVESSKRDSHLKIKELRKFFMDELCRQLSGIVNTIEIGSHSYSPFDIAENENLFCELLDKTRLNYSYTYSYGTSHSNTEINVQNLYAKSGFERRIKALELSKDSERYSEIKRTLSSEKLNISSLQINELFDKYAIDEIEEYKNLSIPDLIDIFIRRGYIDEDYYDYISYFYEGMISNSDRDTLVDIKRQRKGDYLKHIDHIDNFVKELKPYNFTSDSILYVELLDHLVVTSSSISKDYLTLFYKRINRKTAPLKFLTTYYLKGKYPNVVFSQFIAYNPQSTWQQILKHTDESERQSLLCAWLKYAQYPLNKDIQAWINQNFTFIEKNADELTENIIEMICGSATFEKLGLENGLVLDKVIDSNAYIISTHNLSVIQAHLSHSEVDENKVILTEIWNTKNDNLIEYVQKNINESFRTFSVSNKNEQGDALKWLINNDEIDEPELDEYLNGQLNRLQSLGEVKQERWRLVLKNYLVHPSWTSLQDYYKYNDGFDDIIINFIEKYAKQLVDQSFGTDGNIESIFFGEIFKNKNLSLNTIKLLTPIFIENSYDGDEELTGLDIERLNWLLDNEMLVFTDGNSIVLKETGIFSKYLIKYKEEFLQSISENYLSSPTVIMSLMDNAHFNNSERSLIADNIPHTILFSNILIADRIVKHISEHGEVDKDASFYISLLDTSSTNENAVRLATKIILDDEMDISQCNQILVALGDSYSDLTDASKNPKFDATSYNAELLKAARQRGIIISYKPYKEDQLRAYHGRRQ